MIKDFLEANENVTINTREIDKLKRDLPQCFEKNGQVNLEVLTEMIKEYTSFTNEGYEQRFLGKSYGRLLAALNTTTVVVPDEEHNQKPENKESKNIFISGDNLDALKHLLKSYSEKIKLIYIDPPYNTGTDGFVYNDKFTFTRVQLEEKLDVSPEEAERILEMTNRGSASHSAWLTFMYPRLLLARDLLSKDGVIFISIDDNEQANLKLLCNSIFGEENFITMFCKKTVGGKQDSEHFAKIHEYILCYSNNQYIAGKDEKAPDSYPYFDEKTKKYYKTQLLRKWGDAARRVDREDMFYPIFWNGKKFSLEKNEFEHPKIILPMIDSNTEGRWRWGFNTMQDGINNNLITVKEENGELIAYEKIYEPDTKEETGTKLYRTWIDNIKNTTGTTLLKELFDGNSPFDYPKPVDLIKLILKMGNISNNYVLDFFSGSATTAQAVMELNIESAVNLKSKYILVQIPDNVKAKSVAEQMGYATIDQIGMERIRRAAEKIRKEHPDTTADLGFKHYTLREPENDLLAQLEEFTPDTVLAEEPDHILKQFGVPTVITTWLLRDGYGFNAPVQQLDLAGYEAWLCEKHLYLIGEGFSIEAMKALYEKYDTDDSFAVENIIIFGYSFTWTEAQMIKNNLFKIKADDNINRLVNLEIRY